MGEVDDIARRAVVGVVRRLEPLDMPVDLAERAFAGARRRARRRRFLGVAAAVVVLMAAAGLATRMVLPAPRPPLAAAPSLADRAPGRYVVSHYVTAMPGQKSYVLDPRSMSYRPLRGAGGVVATSPDLGYVVVALNGEPVQVDGPTPVTLQIVDTGSGKAVHRWETENVTWTAWSPDGRWIASVHVSGSWSEPVLDRIAFLEVATGVTRNIDVVGRYDTVLAWSPDSAAFYLGTHHSSETAPGRWSYARVPVHAGRASEITTSVDGSYSPVDPPGASSASGYAILRPPPAGRQPWVVVELRTGRVADSYAPPSATIAALRTDPPCVRTLDPTNVMTSCGGTVRLLHPKTGALKTVLALPSSIHYANFAPAPADTGKAFAFDAKGN